MKVLLLGKTGLLGSALFEAFEKAGHQVIAPSHEELDIEKKKSVQEEIARIAPELVVNAVGYTNVDNAEQEQEKAFTLNSNGVAHLAYALHGTKIPLIHFSTDYIFDGTKAQGYTESDAPAPLSIYGASKGAGEFEIMNALTHYYIVRTSWLFGPGVKNFVDTMLTLAEKGEPIRVVTDQIGNPTYTPDLAQGVLRLLKGSAYGTYHMVNEGDTSWYDFAVEIFNQLGVPQKILPITTAELARPAKRPHYSMLRSTKIPYLRPWKEALEAHLTNKQIII